MSKVSKEVLLEKVGELMVCIKDLDGRVSSLSNQVAALTHTNRTGKVVGDNYAGGDHGCL